MSKSRQPWSHRILHGAILERLPRAAEGIDVMIVGV
jgi:hypothetical protein